MNDITRQTAPAACRNSNKGPDHHARNFRITGLDLIMRKIAAAHRPIRLLWRRFAPLRPIEGGFPSFYAI